MTFPIAACVVATEALALLVLWVSLRVSMSRLARPFVACCGLSLAWGAWVLVVVLRGPAWIIGLTVFVFGLASVATAIAIHLATRNDEDQHRGDDGEGPRSRPEAPVGGGEDVEPVWWPEFERQMADYAAHRERQRQPIKS